MTTGPPRRQLPPPPGWAEDPLSDFLDRARTNEYATFNNLRAFYELLRRADSLYLRLGDGIRDPENPLPPVFLHRAHSTLRAASRLALAGHYYEIAPLLRSLLELAVYAHHIDIDHHARQANVGEPDDGTASLGEVWLRRDETEETMAAARRAFRWGDVRRSLASQDPELAEKVQRLYEETIAFGAHPNPGGILSSISVERGDEGRTITTEFLYGDGIHLRAAIIHTSLCALRILDVFRLMFPDRFTTLVLDSDLQDAKRIHDQLASQQPDD